MAEQTAQPDDSEPGKKMNGMGLSTPTETGDSSQAS